MKSPAYKVMLLPLGFLLGSLARHSPWLYSHPFVTFPGIAILLFPVACVFIRKEHG